MRRSGVQLAVVGGKLVATGGKAVITKVGGKGAAVIRSPASIVESGTVLKASDLIKYAESQGFKASQTANGPLKYVDENGVARITIKAGSDRAPGSASPHVEFKNSSGQRTDAFGNLVNRKSLENHTNIKLDIKK